VQDEHIDVVHQPNLVAGLGRAQSHFGGGALVPVGPES